MIEDCESCSYLDNVTEDLYVQIDALKAQLHACQVERDAALYQLRHTVEELNNQESS